MCWYTTDILKMGGIQTLVIIPHLLKSALYDYRLEARSHPGLCQMADQEAYWQINLGCAIFFQDHNHEVKKIIQTTTCDLTN